MTMQITIYCDGSCEPVNPGGYGCSAYVAFEGNVSGRRGAERPAPLVEAFRCIGHGPGMTNNVAEYRAVIGALKWTSRKFPDAQVRIKTDSHLVVQQVNGAWACNKEHLRALRDEARELMKVCRDVELSWVPRDENDVADALTRKAHRQETGSEMPARR